MSFYQFSANQQLAASLDEVWDYITSPKNLKEITPAYMGFEIITDDLPEKVYPGMIISYKVSPLFGIKLLWVTEITHVKEKEYFIDQQRSGPYSFWHHQHRILLNEKGVIMSDIVSYKPPFGFIGSIANSLIIKKQLNEIFEFRRMILENKFGKTI